jgi:hypothetical protein
MTDNEQKYDVTIIRARDGVHIPLCVPRTGAECSALRARGHEITMRPIGRHPTNTRAPTPYSTALQALAELRSAAEAIGDVRLVERAEEAMQALLTEAPSSVQRIRPAFGGGGLATTGGNGKGGAER